MSFNMVQGFSVEVNTPELLKQYLELALPTVLNSTQEIAVKVIDHDAQYKTLCYPPAIYNKKGILPVLLIEGWYAPKDGGENSFFNGYKPWQVFAGKSSLEDSIQYILTTLSENLADLSRRFLYNCGDGYNVGFNHYDGSIGVGYKLISNQTFPESLSLSLVHIYYGK